MIRIVVGLSGASGAIYGVRLLERLRHMEEVETHLIVTRPAEKTLYQETGKTLNEVKTLVSTWPSANTSAPVSRLNRVDLPALV